MEVPFENILEVELGEEENCLFVNLSALSFYCSDTMIPIRAELVEILKNLDRLLLIVTDR